VRYHLCHLAMLIDWGETVMMKKDPILDEIRRVRHEISAQFDHDPVKLVAHYMRLQERRQTLLVRPAQIDSSVLLRRLEGSRRGGERS
jgi:hypothetical protein